MLRGQQVHGNKL
jgi:glutathione S-transferase